MSLDVGELVARLTVDDSRWIRATDQAERRMENLSRTARTEAGRIDTAFTNAGQGANRLGQNAQDAARDLNRVGNTTRDIGRVETTARQAATGVNQIGDAARRASQQVGQLDGSLDNAASNAGSAGEGMGGNFLAGFTDKIKGLGGKGGPIAASLVGVAAVGLAAGAVLMQAVQDGMQMEADQDLIQAKLGVNEETAAKIGRASGAAYANNFGESIAANMDAARAAVQSGLLNGEEDTKTMQGTIEQLTVVSDILGEEIPAVARSARQAIVTGMAKDATGAFDLMVKGQQAGLNASEDWLDTIDEYGTQFRKLGLEGPEAMGLMSQAVKNGARDTDIAADALKEFSIRAVDGSKLSAEGFEAVGLNAEEMTSKIAEGGAGAKEGLDQVLDGLRGIEDPVARNAAAVALFGTQAEDMGDALFNMDLSNAVTQLGEVAGAAKNAGDTMGGNTASSFEGAKRSIETSSNAIKLALAAAFGPELQKLATWVSTHQPEIIGFFTNLADVGFQTLDALMAFSSGSLRAFASMQEGIGNTVGASLEGLGSLQAAVGGFLKHLPGMEEAGTTMEAVGNAVKGYGSEMNSAADQAKWLADQIDAGRPKVQAMGDSVVQAGRDAQSSAELMRALGATVVEDIPDSKTITISDNSPETVKNLEALGFKVENTPNGIKVTATTTEADRILDAYIHQERGITLDVYPTIQAARTAQGVPADFVGPVNMMQRADGGIDNLPDQAKIQAPRKNLVQWAEGETGGEAFIPLALSKRARSEDILAEVARRFGMKLVDEETAKVFRGDPKSLTDQDDPTGWRALLGGEYNGKLRKLGIEEDHPLVNAVLGARSVINDGAFDERLRIGTGMEEDHPLVGALMDFHKFNAQENKKLALADLSKRMGFGMLSFADGGITGGIGKSGLDESMSWARSMDPATYEMGGFSTSSIDCSGAVSGAINKALGLDPFDSRMSTVTEGSWLQAKGAVLGKGPEGTIRVGWWDEGGGANGHTAMTYPDGTNFESNGSEGVVVGGETGWDDPSFDQHAWFPLSGDLGQSSTGSVPAPADSGGGGGVVTGTTDSGVTVSTDGQRVFVTNWPGGSTSSDTGASTGAGDTPAPADAKSETIWSAGIKFRANGGIDNLPGQATIAPDGANLVNWAEPGTGGEGFVPLHPSKRPRSVAITRQIANRFGYELVPMENGGLGGFGGYTGHNNKPTLDIPLTPGGLAGMTANQRRAAMYNLASIGVGGAFAVASGFDENGQFTGQFDTGANSHPALEKGFDQIAQILEEIRKAAEEGKTVNVKVDVDQSGNANLAIMKTGL